ncbi:Toxin ParE4 [Phaeobacter sp. CECT 5382]|uniref:type II toxin-antitoxin system RelE/ParE family toxin n=1 Tax=Phaeobacter sp. CECT 5382 TaxID=1712645 RepID=UPI0006D98930|nr:type II toxin-antitoxin system RelE/ParE family toxin [Phaeobacter sp. CECT 5382]CUH89114.1 Toxin ParE4 [Phaeobacter sp. CECT 5382]
MGQPDPLSLYLTPKAQSDLEEVWLYSVRTWGREQADLYLDTLEQVFETLCYLPELAREYTEISPAVRMHQTGQHVVIYQAQADHLAVIRILGVRQNWRGVIRALDA